MDRKKENPQEWKSERIRAERRERLARMKDKDGTKRVIRSHSIWKRVLAIVVAAVLLVGGAGWLLLRLGVPQKTLVAATVNGEQVRTAELNLVMGLHAMSVFQLDSLFSEENQSLVDELSPDTGESYRNILISSALEELRFNKALSQAAQDSGFEVPESDRLIMEENAAQLADSFTSTAAQQNLDLSSFLELNFGPGASIELVEDYYRESFLANAFVYDHYTNRTFSEEELQAYYEKNQDDYDVVDYRAADFTVDYPEDADEEEKAALLLETQDAAQAMLDKLESVEQFYELTLENLTSEEQKVELEKNPDSQVYRLKTSDSVSGTTGMKSWLFDAERQPGDKTLLETTNGARVLWFEKRARADFGTYTVRHILIKADRAEGSAEELQAAKEEAERIQKLYQDGDKTEASFGELAQEYSEDANAADGGIYEDVTFGTMVSEFQNWALAADRKAGDTGIVQTLYGFHLLYFVDSGGTPYWQEGTRAALANDETISWRDQITQEAVLTTGRLGTRFAGKKSILAMLFGDDYVEIEPLG